MFEFILASWFPYRSTQQRVVLAFMLVSALALLVGVAHATVNAMYGLGVLWLISFIAAVVAFIILARDPRRAVYGDDLHEEEYIAGQLQRRADNKEDEEEEGASGHNV